MYIKKVVIDGFKSYAHRTEIDQFDPLFNAITGLNGSGKSNILDAICFVLGIKNLSHVRANTLQDLVYKNGQAGVTKATVSITFDNRDKQRSPVAYENYDEITITRQVVIGGRNKYLINGVNAQNNRVEDLFRSVQMNVNNPHFIIMQGRITKVLNMKPPEILSMVEEAAGTKLYESKKQAALKTIEKKDAKLREIDAVLKEEITPTLEKLRDERAAYMEYQRILRELEHLSQLVVAYKYTKALETSSNSGKHMEDLENEVVSFEQHIKDNEARHAILEKEMKELEAMRNDEIARNLAELEEVKKGKVTLDIQANSLLENKRESLKGEERKLIDLKKNVEAHKKLLASKKNELENLKSTCGGMIDQGEKDQQNLADAQKKLQALAAGMTVDEKGEAATINEQLLATNEEISRKQTEIKQIEIKSERAKTDLKKFKSQVRQSDTQFAQEQHLLEKLEKELSQLKVKCDEIDIDELDEDRLQREKRSLNNEINILKNKIEDMESRLPQLAFDYKDPTPNFDRSKVKGVVARLMDLKKPEAATALETAAGDRLNFIVIDNEETGKQLLNRGELKRRVTFIPLNKISAKALSDDVIRRAKSLVGDENCDLALSLVGYDGRLENAMKFVFGNTLVCSDMDAAKKVTFHKQVMARSVTLAGELFNPQGTLTGGSARSNFSLLRSVQQLNERCKELVAKNESKERCEVALAEASKKAAEKREFQVKIQAKQVEMDAKRAKLETNDQHRVVSEIKRLETEIAELQKNLRECSEAKTKAEQKARELEKREQNADAYREAEMKEAEKQLAQLKKRVEKSAKTLQEKQQMVDTSTLEIGELENELEAYSSQIEACHKSIQQLNDEVKIASEAALEAKETLQAAERLVEVQKEKLKQSNKEFQAKQAECDELVKDKRKLELKIKKLKQDVDKMREDRQNAISLIQQMKETHAWIAEQEKYFGKAGTQFDFSKTDMQEASRKLKSMQEQKEKLQRNINTRAMNMFTQAEQRCNDLLKKKRIVENDKVKLEEVIEGLDEKKKDALEKAWKQVNQDFGSIFSTLLPNSMAKLEPPLGQTVLDGLEVRVAFGNVWKDSLSDLSGGQRSLVALSLILAMLLFKPAPIYILDEVDAALDVSHTQNIGHMLKTHFKDSQFIVVSLKEGMFTNANVLFQTKFFDGRSTVSRHVQPQQLTLQNQQRAKAKRKSNA